MISAGKFIERVTAKLLGEKYSILERVINAFEKGAQSPDILYLGDSTTARTSDNDEDARSIPDMLQDRIGERTSMVSLSQGAYHMGIYYAILCVLQKTRRRPRLVILPINLRSFSPQWYFQPKYKFTSEINLLNDYISSKSPKIRYRKRYFKLPFHEIPVNYPMTNFNKIGHFEKCIYHKDENSALQKERRRQIFIYFYLYTLTKEHQRLIELLNIYTLMDKLHVKVLTYVTPFNYEAGLRNLGNNVLQIITRNISIIKKALESYRVLVLDKSSQNDERIQGSDRICLNYSTDLDSSCFYHMESLNEHLNQKGRVYLSENLAKIVDGMLCNSIENAE